ncbi:hypothetical protein N7451_012165 [Penicillium sp. IBT 35674x]|nr:hypothetical protein N7451_012165 [Penicillium sp. IBT 35674x]
MLSSILGLWALLLPLGITALASPDQLAHRGISSDLLSNFSLFSQFAALSACDQNINSTGNKLTCDYDLCGLVEADDTETIFTFHNETGPTGYIALDHTKKLIVLISMLCSTPIEDVRPGCMVHEGFWGYWSSIADQVISQLHSANQNHKDYGLAVTGHSLGGAVATIAGTVLRQKGLDLDIWTFGAPKVGNYKLAELITNQRAPVSVYRATHYIDIVPKLPLTLPIHDYSQPSPEYWINQTTGEQVTADIVEYIEGINSKKGNGGTPINFPIEWPDANHGWYFGNLSICAISADAPAPRNT